MTPKSLIAFACGFSIGMAAFAIFQVAGFSLGTLGTATIVFLSLMVVNTGSLTWLLLCEKSIERKPLETLLIAQRTTELGSVISGSKSLAVFPAAETASGRSA
jgi:hypothetical protein